MYLNRSGLTPAIPFSALMGTFSKFEKINVCTHSCVLICEHCNFWVLVTAYASLQALQISPLFSPVWAVGLDWKERQRKGDKCYLSSRPLAWVKSISLVPTLLGGEEEKDGLSSLSFELHCVAIFLRVQDQNMTPSWSLTQLWVCFWLIDSCKLVWNSLGNS